jgi:multidrug resistance efflux pump
VRRRSWITLAASAGLAAGAVLTMAGAGPEKPADAGRFLTVKRRTVTVRLVEFGEVESREVRSVISPIAGEVTWVPDEGALVKAGEPVLKINTETLEASLEEDRKANIGLEGELATQKAVTAATDKHRQAGVRRARIELDMARNALAEARSHPTPAERRLAELDLAAAKLRAERAGSDAESLKVLAERGYVSDARAKAARLDLVRAMADMVRTHAGARETLAGVAPERLRSLEVAVKKAEMNLALAEFSAVADVVVLRENVAVVQTRCQVQSDRLKNTEKDIANATVLAPVSGAVALVDVFKGGSTLSPVQVGESHPQGRELLKIADAGAPRVRVRVSEADIARLAVGQGAEVRLHASPGTPLKGRVGSVAVFAEDKNRKLGSLALEKSGEAGVNAVDVYVDLDIPAGVAAPPLGSTAEVEIAVARFENALAVPLSAVRWERPAPGVPAGPAVRVRRGGKVETAAVKLAATTESEAVVAEGLAEGDEVLLGENK